MSNLNTRDNKVLADSYVLAQQIRTRIESLLTDEVTIELLPDSLVPTGTLYNLLMCHEIMYEELVNRELVSIGQHVPNNTTH